MLLSRSFYSPYNTDVLSEADFSHASLNKTSWMKKKYYSLNLASTCEWQNDLNVKQR